MADNFFLQNVLGNDFTSVDVVESGNAVYKNGVLQYIKLDVDKPGKFFYDLTSVFNASTDEAQKVLPLQIARGGKGLDLNGYTVTIDGTYPNQVDEFHVTGSKQNASSPFTNFVFPLGLFQAVGTYSFTFTISNDQTGDSETTPFCFFDVTQNATTLAVDVNAGIKPYDSDYLSWKNKVETQINQLTSQLNTVSDTANQIKGLMNSYVDKANDYVDEIWQSKLNGNNTWSGINTFSGSSNVHNLTVDGWFDAKNDLTVEQNLHVKGQADLPNNTTIGGQSVGFSLKGQATLEGLSNNDNGTFIHYYANNNFLYITGWIGSPKTIFKTFKAYLPTSITSRVLGGNSSYYVGVNDYDWYTDTSTTQPTEFCLVSDTGVLTINGAANNGGARINWVLPLNQ